MKQTLCKEIEAVDAKIREINKSIERLLLEQAALLKQSGRLKRELCKAKRKSKEPLPRTIDELVICKQSKKALKKENIYLIDELCEKTAAELLNIRGISKARREEIEDALEAIGRHLPN